MTIANYVSLGRILFIPFFVFSLHAAQVNDESFFKTTAIALFILLAFSDWLDGFLARQFDCKSRLGEFLDPAADKLLSLGVLSYLCLFNPSENFGLPFWFGLFYVSRDLILLALYLLLKTVVADVKIVPTNLGKATTFVFFTMILCYLLFGKNQFVDFLLSVNTVLLATSLIFYTRDGYLQWRPKKRPTR